MALGGSEESWVPEFGRFLVAGGFPLALKVRV